MSKTFNIISQIDPKSVLNIYKCDFGSFRDVLGRIVLSRKLTLAPPDNENSISYSEIVSPRVVPGTPANPKLKPKSIFGVGIRVSGAQTVLPQGFRTNTCKFHDT
jgi:hypothetical protein